MKKGRPKKQKVNNQPIAQEQLIERIKIDYLNSSGQITLADLCKKYCLSNLKLRKILITAGVYDTPQYRAIKALKDKGLSDEEIMEQQNISRSTYNSYLPYKRGAYGLDILPDGTRKKENCSLEAKRNRKYRKRKLVEKIKSEEKPTVGIGLEKIIENIKEGAFEMNKCACCGKDTVNLVKVGKIGMCCEHCATVLLMALRERKIEKEELIYSLLDSSERFVNSNEENVPEDAMIFYADDFRGKRHVFSVGVRASYPGLSTYIATEVYKRGYAPTTKYEFEVFGPTEKEEELISELLLKTAKGINNTALEYDYGMPSVKSTGEMRVIFSDNYKGEYGWKIDGRNYSPEEAMKLFRGYEGWRFLFQAVDSSDDILEKDTLLMPVVMNENTFVDELKELITIFTDNNRGQFMSYKNVSGFDTLFYKLLDKLKFYFLHHPRGVGKIAGMKMIRLLENIDTDDDTFPEYQISMIRDVISTNEEYNHPEIVREDELSSRDKELKKALENGSLDKEEQKKVDYYLAHRKNRDVESGCKWIFYILNSGNASGLLGTLTASVGVLEVEYVLYGMKHPVKNVDEMRDYFRTHTVEECYNYLFQDEDVDPDSEEYEI